MSVVVVVIASKHWYATDLAVYYKSTVKPKVVIKKNSKLNILFKKVINKTNYLIKTMSGYYPDVKMTLFKEK